MLAIGKILKSNGTDGGLLVSSSYALEEIKQGEPVFIEFDGLQVPFFILGCEQKGGRYILHLNDVLNLTDSEELVGKSLFSDDFESEEEESDFTGWAVWDHGTLIGKVSGAEPIPGNYCLYITLQSSGAEVLVPLHPDFVENADQKARVLRLNLPEGLY